QTFGADTTNWTRGTGWTFNGTQAVATAATGALTYTTLPDTIISGRAYEVTYTLAGYSAGTVTVAVGNATLALPQHNATANVVLLTPTSATGGFRFTTSNFTGRLDNVAVVEIANPAPVLLAGQDDGAATLYNPVRMPNSTTISNGGAMYSTGLSNVVFGSGAGARLTSGASNNFLGNGAGANSTSAFYNNFFGLNAGNANTTGSYNNFFGEAGAFNTTGSNNNFFGTQAGQANSTGNNNNFFGSFSGQGNRIGNNNNAFGLSAGVFNTTGSNNNFFGQAAGYKATGNDNNFFGQSAGYSNTSGNNNTFIGSLSGYNSSGDFDGSNNTMIGASSGGNIASGALNNLVLGNSVNLPTGNGSNQVVIKNLIFGTGASGTGTTIQTTAKAGINVNNPQSTLDVEGPYEWPYRRRKHGHRYKQPSATATRHGHGARGYPYTRCTDAGFGRGCRWGFGGNHIGHRAIHCVGDA
ncbi:MAG: hypothetical protein EBR82_75025, partial [Caulobacteraceae bacterium]|nr:hypothetical protein [Caulobacteraceae bacterium]